MKSNKNNEELKFWFWLIHGSDGKSGRGKSGIRKILNCWIFVHIFVGIIMAFIIPASLDKAASTVLLPLAGIFVGLSFSWSANAQALLQSKEINELAENKEGGFIDYVYTFQLAILFIIITLILWGFAGLQFFDIFWPSIRENILYFICKMVLYSFSSITIRECWHVVLGTQLLLISKREILDFKQKQAKAEK
jgi:hypothetical protein